MAKERGALKFLGRNIGTFTDWDGDPGQFWWVNDFEPAENVSLPNCDTLYINEENGNFEVRTETENDRILETFDIITILKDIPKSV